MNDFTMGRLPDAMRSARAVPPRPSGRTTSRRRRFARAITALMLLVAVTSTRLEAQANFERGFGRDFDESGAAVEQTADGGFMAAGYTADPRTGIRQVYLVRTDERGSQIWQRRVDVGGPGRSYAVDIHQTANGDHIVVGTADDPTCGSCAHIFAFLISDGGVLVWERLYESVGSIQVATGVVETKMPINGKSGYIGQFVISGYSEDDGGERYAFLMRIEQNGDPMWSMLYDAQPGVFNENVFNAVDETQIGAGAGDIIAVGTAGTAGNLDEVFVARVDPLSGTFGTTLQGSALFGTTQNDRGYSIVELRQNPSFSGDLVITGESDGRPGAAGREILMLELRPSPCDPSGPQGDLFQGDGGGDDDYGRCVREIDDPSVGRVGDVVVTGTTVGRRYDWDVFGKATTVPPPGTPTRDIFLQQFAGGSLAPASPFHTYGGLGDDHGRGVAMAHAISYPTAGFIITGESNSPPLVPLNNRFDLPLVRTDNAMFSCSDLIIPRIDGPAGLSWACNATQTLDPRESVRCRIAYFNRSWQHDVCAQP